MSEFSHQDWGDMLDRVYARVQMLDELPFGVISVSPSGCLYVANRTFEAWLGYAHDELLGHPLMDLVAPPDRDRTAAALSEMQTGAKLEAEFSNRYQTKHGQWARLIWLPQARRTKSVWVSGVCRLGGYECPK